jgi:hypothetical protein
MRLTGPVAYLAGRKDFPLGRELWPPGDYGPRRPAATIVSMNLSPTTTAATKRALAGAVLALGVLGTLAVGQANATPSIPIPPPTPTGPVNDIKIGNRSQLSQSAGDPAPPNQQTTVTGRPQTLVFKIDRIVIR